MDKRNRPVLVFVLDAGMEGLTQGKPFKKMGMMSSPTGELFFDNVRLGPDRLLGESEQHASGDGRDSARDNFAAERIGIAMMALGIINECHRLCVDYAKTRTLWGKNIGQFQLIQLKLAKMEIARMNVQNMVFQTIERQQAGKPLTLAEASAIKLYSSEAATEVAMEAVQLFGGNGYMAEYRVEQLARDAKSLMIYAGSNEVQVTHIAKGYWPTRTWGSDPPRPARDRRLKQLSHDPDRPGGRTAQIDGGLGAVGRLDRHRDHAGEFAPGQDPHPRVQTDPDAGEIAQHLGVGIGDAGHRRGVPVAARPQLAGGRGRHLSVGGRDRVTVRVALREPQLGVDAGDQAIRYRVFEHLGLVVDLVPAVAELVDQEGLQQPVPAHHRQRRSPARLGQRHRAVLRVIDQPLLGEFADRLRGRAGRHPDPVGEHFGADLFHRPLLGIPDDLQIVLANRGETASLVVSPHSRKFRHPTSDVAS